MAVRRLTMVFLAMGLLALAANSQARTWHVERDGSGDFVVIQDAVDAAASGDTILVGPGQYDDYSFGFNNTVWDVYGCINITKDNLVISGAGAGETIVGFSSYPNPPAYTINGVNCVQEYRVVLQSLGLLNCDKGIQFYGTELKLEGCSISGMNTGVITEADNRTLVGNCDFSCCDLAFGTWYPATNIEVEHCEFIGCDDGIAISISGSSSVAISNCTIQGYSCGIQFDQHSSGSVEGCAVAAIPSTYAFYMLVDCEVILRDNFFEGGLAAANLSGTGQLIADNNVFAGGSDATVVIAGNAVSIHGNHLLNGGSHTVRAVWYNDGNPPLTIDLSGNYWGTDDPDQIDAWIDDYNDYDPRDNWFSWVVVDYDPFSSVEMQTESTTWGAVKSMFR
jgi:hypothetical protein